jgi:prepilin-type N-terminal cleavage/methylation domain-containing protein/prepilin-type processing-associated H-X9-DG protein
MGVFHCAIALLFLSGNTNGVLTSHLLSPRFEFSSRVFYWSFEFLSIERIMKTRRAFTLIELLIVVAIIGILAALLFPVFARARENARRASCQSNLKQIGLACQQYSQDYDEKTVPAQLGNAAYLATATSKAYLWWGSWDGSTLRETEGLLFPYMKSSQIQACPSFTKSLQKEIGLTGYAYNQNYLAPFSSDFSHTESISLAKIQDAARTVQMADSAALATDSSFNEIQPPAVTGNTYLSAPSDNYPNFQARHLETGNVLWMDGHVKARKPVYRTGAVGYGGYPAADLKGLQLGDIDEDGNLGTNELFTGTGAP